jgi:hypothetical protein
MVRASRPSRGGIATTIFPDAQGLWLMVYISNVVAAGVIKCTGRSSPVLGFAIFR